MSQKRRLTVAGSVLVMLGATACGADTASDDTSTTLQFGVWTYDLDGVQSILDDFGSYNAEAGQDASEVEFELTEAGYGDYDSQVSTLNTAGQELDVLYGSDHWLARWAEAGWILPIDEHCPDLSEDFEQVTEFSKEGLTHDGHVYGLPYYSDVMYFVYNSEMLSDAGIAEPPSTWAEVAEQAATLKEQGITEDAVMLGLSIDSWFEEQLFALLYSRGGELFDDDLNATFDTGSGPLYESVQWLAELREDGTMPQRVVEMSIQDVQQAFLQGDTAFTLMAGYMLADLSGPESAVAESYEVAMIPGSTQTTAGFTRSYSLGSGAAEDAATMDTACRFLDYHGGITEASDGTQTPVVAKYWATENGLGFSYESLWDDPDIEETFGSFAQIDVLQEQKANARSKEGMNTSWYAEWMSYVRPVIQSVLLGETETEQALEDIKSQWQALAEG